MGTDYDRMTIERALALAHILKYGPFPKPGDPAPTVEEAIGIINEARGACGFNWLTGEAAENVLREQQEGSQ
jgi:hypothetical protein